MKFKFVDIGCGHMCVSTDTFGLDVTGLLVEPIKEYLEVLPIGPYIYKENAAINDYNGTTEFNAIIIEHPQYYTRNELIRISANDKLLNEYCSKNGKSSEGSLYNIDGLNRIEVPCITLKDLFHKYDVTEIEYLKIDVEGYEVSLLKQLLSLMINDYIVISKQITFEYNHLSDKNRLDKLSDIICEKFNFSKRIIHTLPWDHDMVLTKDE